MSKVICDICGTVYPESSEKCPVCGCSRDFGLDALEEEMLLDSVHGSIEQESYQSARKHREIFDFDEVNQENDPEEENRFEEDDEYAEEPRSNTALVVILLVLIVLLLLTAGFFFVRYFLPNMVQKTAPTETTTVTLPVETQPEESTEHNVPCTDIVIPGGKIELGKDGLWLMNVQVYPADTTDVLTYASHNEAVVTVSEDGTVKAVGEGETVIEVTCGNRQIKCNVVVDYSQNAATEAVGSVPGLQVEETGSTDATAEAAAETTQATTEATEAAKETSATEAPKETTGKTELKLKKTDITMFARYSSVDLELDCDIPAEDIKWFTMDSTVAIVHNGTVTATGSGITRIYGEYGDQQVECIVRCSF